MKYLTIFACFLFLLMGFISYAGVDTLHLIAARSINVTLPDGILNKLNFSEKTPCYRVLFYDSEKREQPNDVESNQEVDQLMNKYMDDAKRSSSLKEENGPNVPDSAIMSLIAFINFKHSPEDLDTAIIETHEHSNNFACNRTFSHLIKQTFIEIMKTPEARTSEYIFTSQCKRAQEEAQRTINERNQQPQCTLI